MAILNKATFTIKAQKLQQRSSETWTNPLLSAAGGLTPGQTLQLGDLSSAMETSTNLVAFVSAQKKMPQINLALGIHLLLKLRPHLSLRNSKGLMGLHVRILAHR